MVNLKAGIVGLPNVGKSTLFNALTANEAPSSNYPFCTIDPNIGIVELEDGRLQTLATLSKSKQIIYANMQFVDIAGLVAGASKGEGLGNKFLANIRETDAIVHVVRCFESTDIAHVSGAIDPIQDIEVVNLELTLADLQMVENSLPKIEKQAKGNKELLPLIECLKKAKEHLNANQPVRTLELDSKERKQLETYPFLTLKKVIYVANVAEEELPEMDNAFVKQVREYAAKEESIVVPICAKIEEEIAQLSPEERGEFLESLGLEQSGLQRLIHAAFKLLELITFLTTGEMETRAWPVLASTPAAEAAGKIHTDIQNGFIRAEVISYDDMVTYQGRTGAKEAGKLRAEGRDYPVQDGDVILFLHN